MNWELVAYYFLIAYLSVGLIDNVYKYLTEKSIVYYLLAVLGGMALVSTLHQFSKL